MYISSDYWQNKITVERPEKVFTTVTPLSYTELRLWMGLYRLEKCSRHPHSTQYSVDISYDFKTLKEALSFHKLFGEKIGYNETIITYLPEALNLEL